MIGEEIRRVRERAGLTQEELAFRADLSRNYISLLELNRKSPTIQVLFRICKVLSIKPSTLISRIE
jgi:transcriptional regulator with XRE-family HTH domain